MAKLVISSITNLNLLNVGQAASLMEAFNISFSLVNKLQGKGDVAVLRKLISDCPEVTAMTIELKRDTQNFLFCFDSRDRFVCLHDDLHFSTHCFEAALPPNMEKVTFKQLSFTDKIKATAHISMADEHGLLQLSWSFLCKEQLLSAAELFDVKLTTTQIQNCHNLANVLSAKIRRSDYFIKQYGKATPFANIYFDFSLEGLFICIGHGKDYSDYAENTISGGFNKFYMPSTKQIKQKNTITMKYTHQPSVLSNADKTDKDLCKVKTPQSHPLFKVNATLTLSSASLEQLRGIVCFYNITLDISRRATKNFIVEVIKESPLYLSDLNTSLILSDVIFCFDHNNKVLCSFQELLSLDSNLSISLPKSIVSAYITSTVPDLTTADKTKIMLQRALAAANFKSFSVPWIVLTFSQKLAVVEDYFGSDTVTFDSKTDLWSHLKQSKVFIKQFGSHSIDNLYFWGSENNPLDISIQPLNPKSDYIDFRNHLLIAFKDISANNLQSPQNCTEVSGTTNEEHPCTNALKVINVSGDRSNHDVINQVNDYVASQQQEESLSLSRHQKCTDSTLPGIKPKIELKKAIIKFKELPTLPKSCIVSTQSCGLPISGASELPTDITSSGDTSISLCLIDEHASPSTLQFDSSTSSNSPDSFNRLEINSKRGTILVSDTKPDSDSGSEISELPDTETASASESESALSTGAADFDLCHDAINPKDSASSSSLFYSSDDESSVLKNLSVNDELSIEILPRTKTHIKDHVCLTCNKSCKHETIKCFVCSRKVHFSCYKTQGKRALDNISFTSSLNLTNHKWFCNKCTNLSINDILNLASQKVNKTIQKSCQDFDENHVTQEVEVSTVEPTVSDVKPVGIAGESNENAAQQYLQQDYSFISNDGTIDQSSALTKGQHHFFPSFDIEELTNKIVHKVNLQLDKRLANLQPLVVSPSSVSTPVSYANIAQVDLPNGLNHRPNPISKIINSNIPPVITSNKSLVNKSNSLVIRNIKERKFIKDSPSIKKEFNKHFQQCRVTTAFPTRSGALIIELASREDAEKICNEWRPSHFSNENSSEAGTSCEVLGDIKNLKVILKNVPLHLSDDEVSSGLSDQFRGATFKRFINRSKSPLRVGIATLSCLEHLDQILEGDILMFNQSFTVEAYKPKRRVIQCYNCKQYDHVQKWCPNSYSCTQCSKNHQDNECQNPLLLMCTNCKKDHSSFDRNCPVYLEKFQINNALINQYVHE